MSIPSELGHLAMPSNFPCVREKQQASLKTQDLSIPSSAAAPHWLGVYIAGSLFGDERTAEVWVIIGGYDG